MRLCLLALFALLSPLGTCAMYNSSNADNATHVCNGVCACNTTSVGDASHVPDGLIEKVEISSSRKVNLNRREYKEDNGSARLHKFRPLSDSYKNVGGIFMKRVFLGIDKIENIVVAKPEDVLLIKVDKRFRFTKIKGDTYMVFDGSKGQESKNIDLLVVDRELFEAIPDTCENLGEYIKKYFLSFFKEVIPKRVLPFIRRVMYRILLYIVDIVIMRLGFGMMRKTEVQSLEEQHQDFGIQETTVDGFLYTGEGHESDGLPHFAKTLLWEELVKVESVLKNANIYDLNSFKSVIESLEDLNEKTNMEEEGEDIDVTRKMDVFSPMAATLANSPNDKEQIGGIGVILQERLPIEISCKRNGMIAFTYDGGPCPGTLEVLDAFDGVNSEDGARGKATFHVSVDYIHDPLIGASLAGIVDGGHLLGLLIHEWGRFKDQDGEEILEMINERAEYLKKASNVPYEIRFLRIPYFDKLDKEKLETIVAAGYIITTHNLDSRDYEAKRPEDVLEAFKTPISSLRGRKASFISVQRDASPVSANATESILDYVKGMGYEIVTLDKCLNINLPGYSEQRIDGNIKGKATNCKDKKKENSASILSSSYMLSVLIAYLIVIMY